MQNNDGHLYLTSPLPPSVNHYLGYRAIIKNGRPMAVSYCTNEAQKYKKNFSEYVKEEVKKQSFKRCADKARHIYVDTVFYFDRIDKDCNNYFKCMLDAITDTKLVWEDDNIVCERVNRIYYDSKNPRVELDIYPVDYIGVFENASQLDKFKSNCVGCARFSRNCSILQKAIEGKIQPEISCGICEKFKNNTQQE